MNIREHGSDFREFGVIVNYSCNKILENYCARKWEHNKADNEVAVIKTEDYIPVNYNCEGNLTKWERTGQRFRYRIIYICNWGGFMFLLRSKDSKIFFLEKRRNLGDMFRVQYTIFAFYIFTLTFRHIITILVLESFSSMKKFQSELEIWV